MKIAITKNGVAFLGLFGKPKAYLWSMIHSPRAIYESGRNSSVVPDGIGGDIATNIGERLAKNSLELLDNFPRKIKVKVKGTNSQKSIPIIFYENPGEILEEIQQNIGEPIAGLLTE